MDNSKYEKFIEELAYNFKQHDGWSIRLSLHDKEYLATLLKELIQDAIKETK